ncbi:V-type ATP synthase subunit E [Candidatus Margulisiibacteriota bacterium]
MALKDIEEKIIFDAEAESDSIISEAELKAKDLTAKAVADIRQYSEGAVNAAKVSAEKEQLQALSLARLAARDRILSLKRQLISMVYQDSLIALGKLSKADHEKVISKVLKLMEPLPPKAEVICPKDRVKETEDAVKKAKTRMRPAPDLRFNGKTFDGIGGFILSTDNMQIDGTFESLLDGMKKDVEPEIVKILFGEEK